MTENVHWPNEKALAPDGSQKEVTIMAWDYETKRGTAYLPGLQFVQVKMVQILTIEASQEKKA